MPTVTRTTDGRIVDLALTYASGGVAEFEPGTQVVATNGGVYMFAQAGSALAPSMLGYVIRINTASVAIAQLTTGLSPGTPIVQAPTSVASGHFAWFQRAGFTKVIADATVSVPGPIFIAASGEVTDGSTSADYIAGLRCYATTTVAGTTLDAYMSFPYVSNYPFGAT